MRPTLVVISAPTCAGKSFLMQRLLGRGFSRLVSTCTRSPRAGERQGVEYDFVTAEESLRLERNGELVELVTFNGVRYGVTRTELAARMIGPGTPVAVLEPSGVLRYETICREHGWRLVKVFVDTSEPLRLARLNERTVANLLAAVKHLVNAAFPSIVAAHTDRVLSVVGPEREWPGAMDWDVVVPGDDDQLAVTLIETHLQEKP